jgi:2,5-furandicarboxylate decarboxylase 1
MSDFERFRLRRFMETLVQAGECRVIAEPVELIDVARHLDGEEKAVWFKAVGPERAELVGNVVGSRRRLALGFGTKPAELPARLRAAARESIPPQEVPSSEAPVHQVVEL